MIEVGIATTTRMAAISSVTVSSISVSPRDRLKENACTCRPCYRVTQRVPASAGSEPQLDGIAVVARVLA